MINEIIPEGYVAEKFYQNVFSIPNYPTLKNNEINKVINSIYNLLN